MTKHTATLRRHASAEIDPSRALGLAAAHPALQESGRTIFPTTVVGSLASPRFLISGHNNPKLGKEVLKGARKGWPIFHLTLEERATCPQSCEQWAACYGNAMPHARRHTPDAAFLWLLRAEVATLARQHPAGLLIRLHALGDFYSVEYVAAWAELLAKFPQVHVFGYTARRADDPDRESARIARAIALLTEGAWSRFAIRTSASDPVARSRAIVVEADPGEAETIVCPAQTGATEACATCGLCWSETARDKTIAFLLHGMKRQTGPRAATPVPALTPAPEKASRAERMRRAPGAEPKVDAQAERVLAALRRSGGASTVSLGRLAQEADVPQGSMFFVIERMLKRGLISVSRAEPRAPATFTLLSATAAAVEAAPAPAPLAGAEDPAEEPSADLMAEIPGDIPSLMAETGGKVSVAALAEYYGEPEHRVRAAVKVLARDGRLQFVRPHDSHGAYVFPIGYQLPLPSLTEPQAKVLAALRAAATDDGMVGMSIRHISQAAGTTSGSTQAFIDAVVKKGYAEVRSQSSGHTPTLYRVLPEPAPSVRKVIAGPTEALRAPEPRAATPRPVTEAAFELPDSGRAGEPKTLMNLRADECHWPIGEPDPIQHYCGDPSGVGSQYCADHAGDLYARHRSSKLRPADDPESERRRQALRDRRET